MAQKTIRIAPLADNFSQDDIRKAIGDIKIIRIHTGKNFAYVELENQQDIQILEFTKPDNRFDQLDGAGFKKVEPTFKWGSISSEQSSIQQLKEQPQHFEKIQMSPSNSGQPNPQSLFIISNCDVTILNQLKESQIKSTVFGQFKTIDRVLKRGDKLIIQLLDPVQAQKFQQLFPNLQISALGKSAFVDLEAQNETNFASQWLEQHHKQEEAKDAQGQKVLHEDIIPKIQKLTSMEDDWMRQQQKNSSGAKTESKYFDIAEHSEQHIKTKSELPGVFILQEEKAPGVFLLEPQKIPDSRQQFLIPGSNVIEQQNARKKQEQEQLKKKEQEKIILRQLEQKRKIEEQKLRREIQQRNRQVQIQKQEKEKKEREQREREQKEREQREREQEREKQQREQQERERQQKEQLERERQQREQLERERKDREQKQREHREKQQREKELKEREQQQRIQKQQKQRQQKEREQKEKEQKERQKIAKQQQTTRKSRQNLLKEGVQQGKKGLENFLTNADTEKISNLIGSEQKTPILFWSLVMIALFILLI